MLLRAENIHYPTLCDDDICTGCVACVSVCPAQALRISQNSEGFYRPYLSPELCVGCGKCESSCPVLAPIQRQGADDVHAYACWHKDPQIRKCSSSGGAFTALAESVLDSGGVVFGAAYDEDGTIQHVSVDRCEQLKRLRLSKYAQSLIGESFREVKHHLTNGRKVLFTGTPCQCAGLRSFLKRDYENLIIADLICHGVPSITFLQAYQGWLRAKGIQAKYINFRDKRKGWYDNLRIAISADGGEAVLRGDNDSYWVGFNKNNCLQYSCYACRFQNFPRYSDLTLADFWGIGKQIPFGHKDEIESGVSVIISYNEKAEHLVALSSKSLQVYERSLDEVICGNRAGVESSPMPLSRHTFYKDLSSITFEQFINKYLSVSCKGKLVKFVREYLPYQFIRIIRLKDQK